MSAIGFTFSVWAAVFIAAVALSPVAIAAGIALHGQAQRRARHRRLAFDADWEHAALMDGDTAVGIYGRYRPRRHCPHDRVRGIYGDEINHTPGFRRNQCLDCGQFLDGPVKKVSL